jgi:hypothetical protein
MSQRKDVIRDAVVEWAAALDLPVTIRQADELAAGIARALGRSEPWRSRAGARKPGATHAAARQIAARLEAGFTGRPR